MPDPARIPQVTDLAQHPQQPPRPALLPCFQAAERGQHPDKIAVPSLSRRACAGREAPGVITAVTGGRHGTLADRQRGSLDAAVFADHPS